MALSTVFHSINSPQNFPLSHSLLQIFFCLIGPFNYISLYESLPQPWYNPLWLSGLKAPTTNSLTLIWYHEMVHVKALHTTTCVWQSQNDTRSTKHKQTNNNNNKRGNQNNQSNKIIDKSININGKGKRPQGLPQKNRTLSGQTKGRERKKSVGNGLGHTKAR